MKSGMAVVGLCARQEVRLAVRSRWTQTFAVVFGVLAMAVAGSGYVLSGGSGVQDFSRTSASLLQLILLLVPLAALVFGVLALTPEAGAAELLFSQPVARRAILAGKILGLFMALGASELVGLGAAGALVFARTGQEGVTGFLGVVLAALVLTIVFLGLAAALTGGATSIRRARSLAVALVCWFGAVVLFDVAVLGAASLLSSGPASRLLMISAIANPVDAVRTGTLLMVNGTTAFGAASLAFLRFTGGTVQASLWILLSLILWTAALLGIASRRLRRADI